MHKSIIAAMLAGSALSLPAAAQIVHIDGLTVTAMPAPKCDFGVLWPTEIVNYGTRGPAVVNIARGSSALGSDPFVGTPLAGLSPYLSLSGSYSEGAAVYWQFQSPRHAVQVVWGTPDQWNHLALYDQTGRVKLGELNGAEINRRFHDGTEAAAVSLLIESGQPFYFAVAGTHGHAFELGDVAFDAEEHCGE